MSEIQAASFGTALASIDTEGENVLIHFTRELTSEETTDLNDIVTNHALIVPQEVVTGHVVSAMEFGRQIMIEFAAMNVLSDKSTTIIMMQMEACKHIMFLLLVGSLYTALEAINALPDNEVTPPELKSYFRHKIQGFLGLPVT